MVRVSKKIAALLGIIALLGVILLAIDPTLREYAPTNEAGLVVFIVIDLILTGMVYLKPSRRTFGLVAAWCILRLIYR